MKREKAYLPEDEDLAEAILNGDSKDSEWEWLEEETTYVDLDKGMEELAIILKRRDKYFKFEYYRTSQHSLYELSDRWPIEGEEVFPEVITTTIYK